VLSQYSQKAWVEGKQISQKAMHSSIYMIGKQEIIEWIWRQLNLSPEWLAEKFSTSC
jgi:hypothetical protein